MTIFIYFLSLIRCDHHSRTLLPTLDSPEMFASATAELRTLPCLFLYTGARTDYAMKCTIKYTSAVKRLPASFTRIRPSCRSSPFLLLEASFVLLYRHIVHWQHRASPITYVHDGDNATVYGLISNYFGSGDLEEEDLDVFTLFNELARVIAVRTVANYTRNSSTIIHMHNTDTSIG